jgi:hypothetical protein
MRIIAAALSALLLTTGIAAAQPVTRTPPTAPEAASNAAHPQQFSTERDAKAHCAGQNVVWVNPRSHVYHFAGTRDYGHTKEGAYMCQADADKVGRAAKNEKPPAS